METDRWTIRIAHAVIFGDATVTSEGVARCACGVTNARGWGHVADIHQWALDHGRYEHAIDILEMITAPNGLEMGRGFFGLGGGRYGGGIERGEAHALCNWPLPPSQEAVERLLAWTEVQLITATGKTGDGPDVEWLGMLAALASKLAS